MGPLGRWPPMICSIACFIIEDDVPPNHENLYDMKYLTNSLILCLKLKFPKILDIS